MKNTIFWLEFAQLEDGKIIPIRLVNETGVNTFGSGCNETTIHGQKVSLNLVEFDSMETRSNFIKENKCSQFDIKSSVNVGFTKAWKNAISDIVYFVNELLFYDWLKTVA